MGRSLSHVAPRPSKKASVDMKRLVIAILGAVAVIGISSTMAQGTAMPMGGHHHQADVIDTRTQLDVPAEMKLHQLANMREHVQAIQTILGLIADGNFDEASKVAHSKLGLTPEMQSMCGSFNNEKFEQLGLAFHRSGDALGETLKTKDVTASLRAVDKTMQHCVACHATFRQ